MKKEIIRIKNGIIKQGRILRGPYHMRFYEGEISGIIADASSEKEIFENFFRGKNLLTDGEFYYKGNQIELNKNNKLIKEIISQKVSVISSTSQLTEYLSVIDNIFITNFFLKSRKYIKIAKRLMEFFDLNIPLNKKVKDLTLLERLQIEILHAVSRHHKLIFVSNINGKLLEEERKSLEGLYHRLIRIGYSICQIESLKNISLDKLDYVHVVDQGKCVEELYRPEINYSEIYQLVSRSNDAEKYEDLIDYKKNKLFTDNNTEIFRMENLTFGQLQNINLVVLKRDIIEINCTESSNYRELREVLSEIDDEKIESIYYFGEKIRSTKIRELIKTREIGYIDYSKIEQLVFENLTILENICYPLCLKTPNFFLKKSNMKAAESYIKMILPDMDLDKKIKYLSEEKVMQLVLCKYMLCKPKMLLVFIPAVMTKDGSDYVMDRIIIELNKCGIPVVLISEHYSYETEIIEKRYVLNNGDLILKD